MAIEAKDYQILCRISAQGTAPADVVDLEMIRGPTALTSPIIALEHLSAEVLVGFMV